MSHYLRKYVGTYRVRAAYDLETNEFIRDKDGNLDRTFDDLYIDCQGRNQIYAYGDGILVAYIPSLGRGRNILKAIEERDMTDIIISVEETDAEIEITFHNKHIELFAELLKARTSGAKISPFSVKNLPREKHKWNDYTPKDKEMYDKMLELIKQWIAHNKLSFGKAYDQFYQDFGKVIKKDIKLTSNKKNLKPLHIIDSEGYTQQAIAWLESKVS